MDAFEIHYMLSFCARNYKEQSFEMLNKLCGKDLELNLVNKDGTTAYGILVESKRTQMIQLMDRNRINYHFSQIKLGDKLVTPIYWFLQEP